MKLSVFSFLFILCLASQNTSAQNARVQFIHNSPDTALRYVDIYWNNTLLYNNFMFHRASPFINRPGNATATISIADSSSSSVADAFVTFGFTPVTSQRYLVLLQGIQNEDDYASYQPFELKIISGMREAGVDNAMVDMLFINGSPDSTMVDINETLLLQVPFADSLAYSEYKPYQSIFAGDLRFRLSETESQVSLGDYNAPFTLYGLNAKAVTIITSGFSNPAENSNGELLSMWMARAEGGMMVEFSSTVTSARFIHNSADVALQNIDLYWSNKKVISDLPFRNSSSIVRRRFTQSETNIGVALAGSTSSADVIYTFSYNPQSNDTSLFVLTGLNDATGYSNPQPLEFVEVNYPLPTPSGEDFVRAVYINSSTDLYNYLLLNEDDSQLLSTGIDYSTIHEFEIPSLQQSWALRNINSTYEITSFDLSLQDLSGEPLLIMASGFRKPELNNNGEEFGLWADVNQEGPLVEFSRSQDLFTQVRFLNNSSDWLVDTVDVYVNDELFQSAVTFDSTGVFSIKAESDIELKIVPSGQAIQNSVYSNTIQLNQSIDYLFLIDGIASDEGYNPAPPFHVDFWENPVLSAAGSNQTGVLFYNGSTDIGPLNFAAPVAQQPWISSLSYADLSDDFVVFSSSQDRIMLVTSAFNDFIFGHYIVPFEMEELAQQNILLLTRGFWNPQNNMDGNPFSIWIMKPDGGLRQLNSFNYVKVEQTELMNGLRVYPNPANESLKVLNNGNDISGNRYYSITDLSGRLISSGIYSNSLNVAGLSQGIYYLKMDGYVIRFSVK